MKKNGDLCRKMETYVGKWRIMLKMENYAKMEN